eukprot:1196173-Prorocentrum_minimum.AAC.5
MSERKCRLDSCKDLICYKATRVAHYGCPRSEKRRALRQEGSSSHGEQKPYFLAPAAGAAGGAEPAAGAAGGVALAIMLMPLPTATPAPIRLPSATRDMLM